MTCAHCGHALPANSRSCTNCGKPQSIPLALAGDEPTHVPVRVNDLLEGKWRLERKLGEGGMGTVYLAHDLQLDRKVAIKLLAGALVNDAELVTRFEREARVTAGLEHPNIVPVYAVGRHDRRPFMVMKALEGRTLSIVLREKGSLQGDEAIPLFRQLASGLDFIHSKGFVHRDIKAGNIYVGSDGHGTILDFGILRPSRNAEALTKTGMVMGTPQYMSPEQALGIRDIDHRSDLYALAVLLFECLTGSLPFDADNDLSVIQMQAHTAPPDACQRAPWLPRPVADVLTRALSKDPNRRYPSAMELIDALEQGFAGIGPMPTGMHLPAPPQPRPAPPRASGPKPMLPGPRASGSKPMLAGSRPSGPKVPPAAALATPAPESDDPPALESLTPEEADPSTAELAQSLKPRRWPLYGVGGVLVLAASAGGLYVAGFLPQSTWHAPEPELKPEVAAVTPAPDAAPTRTTAADAPAPETAGDAPTPNAKEDEPAALARPAEGEKPQEAATEPSPTPVQETPSPSHTGKKPGSTPSASAQGTRGKLNVVSTHRGEPYWASVLVDGERVGKTPMLVELAAGKHTVRVERVGFRPVEKQIKIAPGRLDVLRIKLVP